MITITQTCDACTETRELKVGHYGQPRDIRSAAQSHGWREVRDGVHLCSPCINDKLGVKP